MTPVGKNQHMTSRTRCLLNSNRKKVGQCSSQNVEMKKIDKDDDTGWKESTHDSKNSLSLKFKQKESWVMQQSTR